MTLLSTVYVTYHELALCGFSLKWKGLRYSNSIWSSFFLLQTKFLVCPLEPSTTKCCAFQNWRFAVKEAALIVFKPRKYFHFVPFHDKLFTQANPAVTAHHTHRKYCIIHEKIPVSARVEIFFFAFKIPACKSFILIRIKHDCTATTGSQTQ